MRGNVARKQLVRAVGDGLEAGSVILTAAAGCGKTTVLEQVAAKLPWPVAWISCSETERAPGTLLMRIVSAIARAAPGASDALAERLLSASEQIDVPAATAELIAELGGLLVEPLLLVVDDAEQLDGAVESVSLLGELIRAELSVLRVAIASRRPLELRVAKARAGGRLTELGTADLAFDAEECAVLLREGSGVEPSTEQVADALQATEGWALGIVLAAGALRRGTATGAGLADLGTAPDLRAYFAEELLDQLSPALRKAVIELSVVRFVTAEVRRTLGLPDDFQTEIERAGVLVRPLGDGESFAYHPLLRRFLADRLEEEQSKDEWRRLHATVAPAVAADGDAAAAIEHWLQAQRWEEAVTAIEAEGLIFAKISPELIRRWLAVLPEEQLRSPTMRALQGQLESLSGDHAGAVPALRDAIAGFRESPNPAADWLTRLSLVDALFATGEIEELDAVVAGWDEPAAAEAGGIELATAMYGAVVFAAFGRFEHADRLTATTRRHPGYAKFAPMEALGSLFSDLPAGRLDEAEATLECSVLELSEFDPLNRQHYALGALALLRAERGEPEEALAVWAGVRENIRGGAAPLLDDAAQGWHVLLHAQAGRRAEAEAELAGYRQVEQGTRSFIAGLAPATVASLRGDAAATERWAERALQIVASGGIAFRYWTAADLVPALAEVGRRDRANAIVADALALIEQYYPGDSGRFARARLLGLRAWLRQLEGDLAAADADLVTAWGEAGEARRFLLRRDWSRLEKPLWGALERGALEPAETVAELSTAFPGGTQLVPLLEHPREAVRVAAIRPTLRSGDPRAHALLKELGGGEDPGLAQTLPPLHFELLGRFGVRRGAWQVSEERWERPVDARLLRVLLVHEGRPVSEAAIFEALWPKLSAAGARRSLHVAVSRIRRLLDPPGGERSVIESRNRSYRLALDRHDTVDAREFEDAAAAAGAVRGAGASPLLQRARSLWTGEPLPEECHTDWASAYRKRLLDVYTAVLAALIELDEEAGRLAAVIDAASELVELDPLNEGAHRALIRAYARAGRRGEALRQYLECRRTLVEQLGVEPAEETSRLQGRVLAGESV